MSKARSLTPRQINKTLQKCLLMQSPELKRAAVVLSHSTLRCTELAQLTIADLLYPSGEIRTEIHLRSKLCKNKKPRPIWLNKQAIIVMQEWLDYRKSRHWGLSLDGKYQGFNPMSAVLFNNRGRPYSLKRKPHKFLDGTVKDYWACDTLEYLFRDIYQRCGLHGASSHSGRRSWATNANRKGVELEIISKGLGHSDVQVTLEYIDIRQSTQEGSKISLIRML